MELNDPSLCISQYNPDGEPVAYETAEMYAKSVQKLYTRQKNTPGRSPHVSDLMTWYKDKYLAAKAVNREAYVMQMEDQGDELAVFKQLMRAAWMRSYLHQGIPRSHARISLRLRLDTFWSHYCMSRGESMRYAVLGDLTIHTFEAKDDAGQICMGVVMAMPLGKTSKHDMGNNDVMVRSRDVELCPIGTLGFYLLDQWMV